MFTINVKGKPNPKDKNLAKLELIFFQTGYNRASRIIEISGLYKDWDSENQCFKSKTTEAIQKNKLLTDLKLKYLKVAEDWTHDNVQWNPIQWSHYFDEAELSENKVKVKSVSQMIDSLIESFSKKERFKNGKIVSSYSNIREYEFLKSSLNAFTKKKYEKSFTSYYFKDINETFLNDYSLYLQQRGFENGNKGAVVSRLKKLRAVCNHAKEEGMQGINMTAFNCVGSKMKHGKFTPKTLSHEIIKKIEDLDMNQFSNLEQFHIDLFLFSFYAGGMANIDVAYLTWNSIKGNKIEYERTKVCKEAKAPLISKARTIISKYKDKSYLDYIFPIFTPKHITEKQKRQRLERLYIKVNNTLEKVRKEIKYKEKITWYSARGSYITKMINDGYNPAIVAEHAGNSAQMIFKHYYKIVNDDEILNDMENKF